MNEEVAKLFKHGTITSYVHCKQTLMLKRGDFVSLFECESVEDICARIQNLHPEIVGMKGFNKGELKKKLYAGFRKEIQDGLEEEATRKFTEYFLLNYRINNFFFLLSAKENDFELVRSMPKIELVGYFNELDTLKFCANMEEADVLCVKNSFLDDYWDNEDFSKEFKDNDFSIACLKYKKRHIHKFYDEKDTGFAAVLRFEGDKINFDVVQCTLEMDMRPEKRLELMCKISNLNIEDMKKLAAAKNVSEMKIAVSKNPLYSTFSETYTEDDVSTLHLKIEMEHFVNVFTYFNDVISVYAYYKLKEQEIKNIIWVADCVISGQPISIDTLVMPETKENPEND